MEKLLKSRLTRTLVAVVCVLGGTPLLLKGVAKKSDSATAAKSGLAVFERRCGMCHYSDRVEKRVGPGLKGFYKRGKFITSGNKVTDESVKAWIQNGDSMMPPFKDVLDTEQLNDLIAYLRTL
jgi:cytochrome c